MNNGINMCLLVCGTLWFSVLSLARWRVTWSQKAGAVSFTCNVLSLCMDETEPGKLFLSMHETQRQEFLSTSIKRKINPCACSTKFWHFLWFLADWQQTVWSPPHNLAAPWCTTTAPLVPDQCGERSVQLLSVCRLVIKQVQKLVWGNCWEFRAHFQSKTKIYSLMVQHSSRM